MPTRPHFSSFFHGYCAPLSSSIPTNIRRGAVSSQTSLSKKLKNFPQRHPGEFLTPPRWPEAPPMGLCLPEACGGHILSSAFRKNQRRRRESGPSGYWRDTQQGLPHLSTHMMSRGAEQNVKLESEWTELRDHPGWIYI